MKVLGSEPVFSPAEFVAVFNQSIEMILPTVGIVGEMMNFRVSKGVWVYFDLKDEAATVKFFGTVRNLPGPLEEGMMLEVHGRPYLHPKFGFSVQVDSIMPVGQGTLRKAQDLLAKKLEAEGLFDESRKRSILYPPNKIGLITSVESAAYSDFLKIIASRWPALKIEVFDVQVQGKDAPLQIIEALEEANQQPDLDALVMVRGGGSAEDLAAFNVEQVVRAISASRVPTLVAIGHERDISLSELAADLRASTPSNAAELLVPDLRQEQASIKRAQDDLSQIIKRILAIEQEHVSELEKDLSGELDVILRRHQDKCGVYDKLLDAYNPKRPLRRGYALVRSPTGQHLATAAALRKQDMFEVEFSDGKVKAKPTKNE